MKKFSSYLVVMFMVMFWILRILITVLDTVGTNIGFTIPDYKTEVVLLFLTIPIIILVYKRKFLGAILYIVTNGIYFGSAIFTSLNKLMDNSGTVDMDLYINMAVYAIGIILPLFALFELLLDKNRKDHPVDKKTDWFYKNEKFDREMDDRADKNNYRTL